MKNKTTLSIKKRTLCIAVIGFFIFCKNADAQVTLYTTTTFTGTTTSSFSHTVGGTNPYLLVYLSYPTSITSISLTYNGSGPNSSSSGTGGSTKQAEMVWTAPTAGTNTIAITVSGGSGSYHVAALSFYNYNSAGGSSSSSTTFTGTASFTTGSIAPGAYDMIVGGLTLSTGTITDGGSGQVSQVNVASAPLSVAVSTKAAGVGSSFTWSSSASGDGKYGIRKIPGLNALPIELLSFNAACDDNNKVKLNWITASEINNDYFTIESSTDAVNFYPRVVINGAGNSNTQKTYFYSDEQQVKEQTLYYRLKQTDYDGKYTYSAIVPLICNVKGLNVLVLPNPVAGNLLTYEIRSEMEKNVTTEIFNNLGQMVLRTTMHVHIGVTRISSDISILSNGMYTIKVTSDKQMAQKKFTKELVTH